MSDLILTKEERNVLAKARYDISHGIPKSGKAAEKLQELMMRDWLFKKIVMKSIKKIALVLLLLIPSVVNAQTVSNVLWSQEEIPAVTQTITYTLAIDTTTPITLVPTCVTAATGSDCSAPFPAVSTNVPHTYTLTATNSFGSTSITIGPGKPPVTTKLKITIVVIVK